MIEKLFGAVIVRFVALTMPEVIVSGRLNGLPIATTLWPGCTDDELPSASGWSLEAGRSTWITAVSVDLSPPTSVAFAVEPSSNLTWIELAAATTCSAVRMLPFVSISNPLPNAWTFCRFGPPKGSMFVPAVVVTATVTTTAAHPMRSSTATTVAAPRRRRTVQKGMAEYKADCA